MHVHNGAVGLFALTDAKGDLLDGVLAWVNSSVGGSDSAGAGIALAGSLAACLLVAAVVSYRRRSRF